jgi:SAM-dependent methyltransferase
VERVAVTIAPPTSPAADRNTGPILQVLKAHLPGRGRVLEIASGVGQHAAAIARALPDLDWTPSDPSAEGRDGIETWRKASGLDNLRAAEPVNAADPATWPSGPFHAVVCINMVHISPWGATEGLMGGAAEVLVPGGLLYLYGPYREADIPLAPSNADFDQNLKARNPEWGLRALEDVSQLARDHGLRLTLRVEMPANNLSLLFRKI